MTHVDLFSGIGGFALAAQWAGFRTEVFCEIEPFCREVLKARFGAIEDTTGKRLEGRGHGEKGIDKETVRFLPPRSIKRPLLIPDIRTFDGTRFRDATLLTGGFPCQPVSCAGKRRGKEDDRWLWPEMLRVISEARPAWVLGENVAGIIGMELEQVCLDLEGQGYEVQPITIPACALNAPHRRDRVWIIGYSQQPRADSCPASGRSRNSISESNCSAQNAVAGRNRGRDDESPDGERKGLESEIQTEGSGCHASDAERKQQHGREETRGRRRRFKDFDWDTPWPEVATRFCRVDDGLPTWIHRRRTERLRALGNSIVPQVAHEIIRTISEIEEREVGG